MAVEVAELAPRLDERRELRTGLAQRNAGERLLEIRLEPRAVVGRMQDGTSAMKGRVARPAPGVLTCAPRAWGLALRAPRLGSCLARPARKLI